jgi:hypothetical protein
VLVVVLIKLVIYIAYVSNSKIGACNHEEDLEAIEEEESMGCFEFVLELTSPKFPDSLPSVDF